MTLNGHRSPPCCSFPEFDFEGPKRNSHTPYAALRFPSAKRLNTYFRDSLYTRLAVCRPRTGEQCELRGTRRTTKARVQPEEKGGRQGGGREKKYGKGGRDNDTRVQYAYICKFVRSRQFASCRSIREQCCKMTVHTVSLPFCRFYVHDCRAVYR